VSYTDIRCFLGNTRARKYRTALGRFLAACFQVCSNNQKLTNVLDTFLGTREPHPVGKSYTGEAVASYHGRGPPAEELAAEPQDAQLQPGALLKADGEEIGRAHV
jgi:hypothetical protein